MLKPRQTVKQWYDRQLSQVQLTEYGIPHPFKGIGDGEKIRLARIERANATDVAMFAATKPQTGESHMANEKTEQKSNRPEKKFRFGCVTATIWKNEIDTKSGKFEVRSLNLEKSYKDSDGNWKNTGSLKTQDVPKAMLCLEKAYEFMVSNHEDNEE